MHSLQHKFVKEIPEEVEEGVVYISLDYATAIHKCACGCSKEVVTPFSPTDWKLIFDGETISLSPSIGNWSFPCRSHYFVREGRIVWAGAMTEDEIQKGRLRDLRCKKDRFVAISNENRRHVSRQVVEEKNGFVSRIIRSIGFFLRQK